MKGTPTNPQVKEIIINRVKAGEDLNQIASEFKLYPNTIRKWLAAGGVSGTSDTGRNHRSNALLLAKAQREKQELLAIIGELMVANKELSKKNS